MLLWRVIAIRAQFIRHVEWKSVSNLEQELICLPDGPQFIPARSPILLDEDFLHASLFSASSSFFQSVVPWPNGAYFGKLLVTVGVNGVAHSFTWASSNRCGYFSR